MKVTDEDLDKNTFELKLNFSESEKAEFNAMKTTQKIDNQSPVWNSLSETIYWLNEIEKYQGGANGPTIKLRAAIMTMRCEKKVNGVDRSDPLENAQMIITRLETERDQLRSEGRGGAALLARMIEQRDKAEAERDAALLGLVESQDYAKTEYMQREKLEAWCAVAEPVAWRFHDGKMWCYVNHLTDLSKKHWGLKNEVFEPLYGKPKGI